MSVWEPAAGNHLMAGVLRESGAAGVVTSDIAVYDRPHDSLFDFLKEPAKRTKCDAIITNPPYGPGNRDAVQFARLALQRCDGLVALLLTAKFDFGSTRRDLFRDNPRFRAKIALTDRLSWTLDGETGTEDHAWYAWAPTSWMPMTPMLLYAGKDR